MGWGVALMMANSKWSGVGSEYADSKSIAVQPSVSVSFWMQLPTCIGWQCCAEQLHLSMCAVSADCLQAMQFVDC